MKKRMKWDFFPVLRMLVAVAISFVLVVILVFIVSETPMRAIDALFAGPVSNMRNFTDVLSRMVPIVFTALGMNLVIRSGLFNLASDSSLYMSAVLVAIVAIRVVLPAAVLLPLMLLLAAVVGALINVVPALLRRYTGANETVVSLMFNFIFFFLGMFIMRETILDARAGNVSQPFQEAARIGRIFPDTHYTLHWGFVAMLAVVVIMYFVVERSKFGYQVRIVGLNRQFAKYSGIKVGLVVLTAQLIGGALAGVGGTIDLLGMFPRFQWNLQDSVAYVWDGLLVNNLSVGKPIFIPLAAFFLAYLRTGSQIMTIRTDVDLELITILQAIMLVLVSSDRFMYGLKLRREQKIALEQRMLEEMESETVPSSAADKEGE
ncbi:MAG: ABC transporter permease [Oscillospiraceae bacterium]|nr:ABC transporter permease [Oscillospiraceae bacterium]